ncbi:T9SS type A sorting domain-containing protein [Lacinutrix salivirga]
MRNNSFVFVTDEVLFVTDDVNLEETNASLYLRNEAQLVQGPGTTGNSGIGKLSVFQSGTVNQYAYNYWASPVGNASANDNANRDFIPNQQFFDFIGDPDPALNPITSVPAMFTYNVNGTSSPLVISDRWLYSYDPGISYTEWDYLGDNGNLAAGYGFTMKGMGTAATGNQLYDFRGKPNNGTIEVDIEDGLQTLAGNPYPSALDAYAFIHDVQNAGLNDELNTNGGFTGALYYWEQSPTNHTLTSYLGGYATYTNFLDDLGDADPSNDIVVDSFTFAPFSLYDGNGNPLGFPTGTGSKVAYRYIPIGQGFFIEGAAGIPTNTKVYFKNSHRAFYRQSGAESYFFRNSDDTNTNTLTENGLNTVPSSFKRFRINVGFNEDYNRQLLMNFHHSATAGFDYGLEAKPYELLASDAHWTLNNNPYVIQAFNFDLALTIPLVIKAENQQPLNFNIVDIQNFDESQPIYIHDIENNIYVDLRNQDYSINIPAGVYTDRFEITFTQNTLSVDTEESNTFQVYQNNTTSELTVNNPNGLDVKSVTLYDVAGKRVLNQQKLKLQTEYRFSTKNLSDGVYITKVDVKNGESINKKVIISSKN